MAIAEREAYEGICNGRRQLTGHDAMLRLSDTHNTRLLADMIVTDKYGYYHATNEGGFISWYDFAREIFRQAGKTTLLVTTAKYGVSKAKRPFNSRLDKSKLTENGFQLLSDWQNALARHLKEMSL